MAVEERETVELAAGGGGEGGAAGGGGGGGAGGGGAGGDGGGGGGGGGGSDYRPLLRGLFHLAPPVDPAFFVGADALAASGDVTRIITGDLYRGVTFEQAALVMASHAAFSRLHSALSALDGLPPSALVMLSLGRLPPPRILQQLAERLPPAVRAELSAGAHLLPLLFAREGPLLSMEECAAACAKQVSEGGHMQTACTSFTAGSGYIAKKWSETVSTAPGAKPPSRMVVRVRVEDVEHARFLRVGGSALMQRLLPTQQASWAARADEVLLFTPSGIPKYDVVVIDGEVVGALGPPSAAPVTPWYVHPALPVFQSAVFIFTNCRPVPRELMTAIRERGGKVVDSWSAKVTHIVADVARTDSNTLRQATKLKDVPPILTVEQLRAGLALVPVAGAGAGGGGGGGGGGASSSNSSSSMATASVHKGGGGSGGSSSSSSSPSSVAAGAAAGGAGGARGRGGRGPGVRHTLPAARATEEADAPGGAAAAATAAARLVAAAAAQSAELGESAPAAKRGKN